MRGTQMFVAIQNDADRDFIADLYYSKYKIWFNEAYELTQDIHAAEDIINDVFVKLFGKIDILREMECNKSTAYITISIKNSCKRYLKTRSRKGIPVDFERKDSFNTEKLVLDKLDLETVRMVFKELTDFERDLLVKSFFEQLSDKEIAEETGIKYNNIRTYRCRLISKIKRLCNVEKENKIHE